MFIVSKLTSTDCLPQTICTCIALLLNKQSAKCWLKAHCVCTDTLVRVPCTLRFQIQVQGRRLIEAPVVTKVHHDELNIAKHYRINVFCSYVRAVSYRVWLGGSVLCASTLTFFGESPKMLVTTASFFKHQPSNRSVIFLLGLWLC